MGHGGLGIALGDAHFLPVAGVASDGGVHGAGILLQPAHGDGLIHPGQGVILELGGQSQVGPVVLRGDDQAGGIPVDAVDNARAQLPVDSRE